MYALKIVLNASSLHIHFTGKIEIKARVIKRLWGMMCLLRTCLILEYIPFELVATSATFWKVSKNAAIATIDVLKEIQKQLINHERDV